jgi:hypothetical protein
LKTPIPDDKEIRHHPDLKKLKAIRQKRFETIIKSKKISATSNASPKHDKHGFYIPPKQELDQIMDLYDPPMPNPSLPNVDHFILDHQKPAQRVFTSNAAVSPTSRGIKGIQSHSL